MGYVISALILFLPFGITLASIVFFLVNFINYCAAKRRNKKKPGSIVEDWIDWIRRRTVISGVVAAVLTTVCGGYLTLFFHGLAHM